MCTERCLEVTETPSIRHPASAQAGSASMPRLPRLLMYTLRSSIGVFAIVFLLELISEDTGIDIEVFACQG